MDVIKSEKIQPSHVRGQAGVYLKNPRTGKIVDGQEGKNLVFTNGLFGDNWVQRFSKSRMVLTDSTRTLDINFPFILGKTIGYGDPSTAGMGLNRGSYDTSAQVLEERTWAGISWKFKYDFLTTQAIGTIGTIGLSQQHTTEPTLQKWDLMHLGRSFTPKANLKDFKNYYRLNYATLRIYDYITDTNTDLDLSAIIGANTDHRVGRHATNGRFYIYTQINSEFVLIEFTDDTFTTVVETYPCNNANAGWFDNGFVVYDGKVIYPYNNANAMLRYFNYINNTPYEEVQLYRDPTLAKTNEQYPVNPCFRPSRGFMTYNSYLFSAFFSASYNTSGNGGIIFDLNTMTQVGVHGAPDYTVTQHPRFNFFMPCSLHSNTGINYGACALAGKKLAVPVVKTDQYALSATYEIYVEW